MLNLWRDKDTNETCHVVSADYDPVLDLTAVLVCYFGGEMEPEFLWFSAEEFFEEHVPERIHS